jgi:hypothetical protein
MKYTAPLSIPANTPSTKPVTVSLTLHEPIITGYEIFFPPGCAALAGIALLAEGIQFAPAAGSSDMWFRKEGSISWFGQKRLIAGKTEIKISVLGYNDDDTYPHKPIIYIDTLDGVD